MTRRKETALAHPVAPSKWASIRQAERVTYPSAVAAPQRIDWRTGDPYKCPELQHRSRGQNIPCIVLGKRVTKGAK